MTKYIAKFFKTLLSSDGHPCRVLQRVVRVNETESAQDATEIAEKCFEQAEHVPEWQLHADYLEISVDEPADDVTKAA